MSYINRHSFPGHCEVRVQSLAPNGGKPDQWCWIISNWRDTCLSVYVCGVCVCVRVCVVCVCVCVCVCCDIIICRVLSISLGTDGRPHHTTSRQIWANMGCCLWPIFRIKACCWVIWLDECHMRARRQQVSHRNVYWVRCSEIGEWWAGEYRGDGYMQVYGAGTDILLVHRRVESGCTGERGSMLENRWKRGSPGIILWRIAGESRW